MMKRTALAIPVILTALLGWPLTADAGIMDWIQELSGPGPSTSRQSGYVYSQCFGGGPFGTRAKVMTSPDAWFNKTPCLFVDYRRFHNNPKEDNFPAEVNLSFYDFGPTWEFMHEGQIQVGAGLGFMRSNANGVQKTRFTFSYLRGVVQPLSLVPAFQRSKASKWLAVFKAYGRATVIPGTMDATDFGVALGTGAGQSTWQAHNDHLWSAGFLLDFGELIR